MNYNNQQLYMITNNYFVDMRLFSNEYTLTGINAFKKNLIKDYGGENMSSSDIEIGYWRVYFVAYGGLFFAGILVILGALRANIYISCDIEYILLGVGILLSGIDYLLSSRI